MPLEKVKPGSPDQCEGITLHGEQCLNKRVPNYTFCQGCLSSKQKTAIVKDRIDLFRLAVWQKRLNEQKDHSHLKTLNHEIGILRIMVEERINACKNSGELILHSQSISELLMKINLLVVNSAKLDLQLNQTLNKTQVESFSNQVIAIISEHIPAETLEIISDKLAKALGGL